MKFSNHTVLVTGASRGIGAAIAQAFAAEGAFVVVNYLRNHDAAAQVVAACEAQGGGALAIAADVTCAAQVADMMQQIEAATGRLDVVVNNAFAPYRFDPDQRQRFWETSWSAYQMQFDGAVNACYNVCQAALPLMRRRARGSIINLVSDLIARPAVAYHDYITAKAALTGFSRTLAAELGALGIRVNCVAPGLVYPTDASQHTPEAVRHALTAQTPLGRLARAADVAGPVLFLASAWSEFVTGQTLYVDGGLVMQDH
ncbi:MULTISPECIES: SDR family oxidoreductase [unclassified Pantoea]|uniref:SDR family oxidoreductase n=1 Tax=unclassified Pantoea TaxID=2630326 RepID=UPI0012329579|nr:MULTISPECIES: SDR family oxidoreductase [unclassified Pantoea]KAA6094328.1 SDR family oxidoreductase [Pantoea sp. B_9]KAA6107830.1 SDR family oxidoreductase [Pantoea sp. B_10]